MKAASSFNQTKKEWFSFLQRNGEMSNSPITVLVYEKEYPLSFISFYIKYTKQKIITVDLSDTQYNNIEIFERMLQSTFLGSICTYVIKTAWEDLSHIQQKYLLHVIHTYSGPHRCIIPIEQNIASACITKRIDLVHIPNFLTMQEALFFAQHRSLTLSSVFQKMLKNAFQQTEHISFKTVIMLLDYAVVVSSTIIDDFSVQMLPLLLNTKQSLYELSGQLFNKKQTFFKLWYQIEASYSQAFWTTFWCDQFMKAALFCAYKKSGIAQEAQVIGIGLPFSFLNKDWRLYNSQTLSKAYNMLYEYDCRVKDNILIKSLDSFFIMFFMHEFD